MFFKHQCCPSTYSNTKLSTESANDLATFQLECSLATQLEL